MTRFVILYQGVTDPPMKEQRLLLSSLQRIRVIDGLPGNVLVDGLEEDVALVVNGFKMWTFSPVGTAFIQSPHGALKPPV